MGYKIHFIAFSGIPSTGGLMTAVSVSGILLILLLIILLCIFKQRKDKRRKRAAEVTEKEDENLEYGAYYSSDGERMQDVVEVTFLLAP